MGSINSTQNESIFELHELKISGSPRILIVEDDMTYEPIWAYIVDQVDGNAKLDWATSVTEAEQKIKSTLLDKYHYDVIIADIFLSGSQTGIDLYKKYYELLASKVILVSSVANQNVSRYLNQSEEAALLYLQKPLIVEDCIRALKAILNSN